MNVLYLTNNWQLASTARILMSWLTEGRAQGVNGRVVVQRVGSLSAWLDNQSIPWRRNAMRWPDRRKPFAMIADLTPLALWARRHRIELIHCNEHDVYPFGVVLRRVLGVPIVCHVRFRVGRQYCEWSFGGRRQPDALLWTSRQQMADCAEAVDGIVARDRQHFMPLGVDLSTFGHDQDAGRLFRRKLGIREDEIVLASASALRPIKRIHEFVALISEIGHRHPNVVGVIAGEVMPGDEEYGARIRAQIQQTGLGRRLQLVGHLEPVEPLHQAADIFVSTSEYETFGNSVCEAMACGVPVVAYQGGSVGEVVSDGGVIVDTGDFTGLVNGIERLIHDVDARHALGVHGRGRVSREYNPASTYLRLKHLYEELVTTAPGGRVLRADQG